MWVGSKARTVNTRSGWVVIEIYLESRMSTTHIASAITSHYLKLLEIAWYIIFNVQKKLLPMMYNRGTFSTVDLDVIAVAQIGPILEQPCWSQFVSSSFMLVCSPSTCVL